MHLTAPSGAGAFCVPICYLNKFTYAAPVLGWLSNGAFPGAAAMAAAEAGPCDAAGELAGGGGPWQNLTSPSLGMNLPSARPIAAENTRDPGGLAGASDTRAGK